MMESSTGMPQSDIVIGGVYTHFSGNGFCYTVKDCFPTDYGLCVLYESEFPHKLYVRDIEAFLTRFILKEEPCATIQST
jgi:hypothetical protein